MNNAQKQTDKLNLIDRKVFEKLQQANCEATRTAKPIRNAKYKKKHAQEFDLFSFIKEKPKTSSHKRHGRSNFLQRKVLGSTLNKFVKRRGKVRAGGLNKKRTTLKKTVLRYRQLKREAVAKAIDDLSSHLEVLRVSNKPGTVHSRKFRSYCDNCTTPELCELTDKLLRDLDRFQKRARQQNEIKAHAKRRFVVGFRECNNFLRINKAKLVIIAPDCEECEGEYGLDALIAGIKKQCQEHRVPYVFCLQRRQLAYTLFKKVPISCVTILDYDGANETFGLLLTALKNAQNKYQNLFSNNNETVAANALIDGDTEMK